MNEAEFHHGLLYLFFDVEANAFVGFFISHIALAINKDLGITSLLNKGRS